MATEANRFRLGLFIIASAVALVGVVVVLGAGRLFRKQIQFVTVFDSSVQGLEIGSALKYIEHLTLQISCRYCRTPASARFYTRS